ncbi:MAG: PAS domain S-box protein [Deltaproteobacteria bacterium]|nr:PAS domain S-box protein [Deltaproteobacteria bacterium]
MYSSAMVDNEQIAWKERFSDTAELLPGIICEINQDLRIIYVNRLGLESFKYTKEDFDAGVYLSDIMHPEDKSHFETSLSSILKGNPRGPQEYRMVHKDGTVRLYQVNSSPVFDGDKVCGIRTCVFDISDRKEAEDKLRQSEERFRRIFTQSPIGVALINYHGQIIDTNEAFRRMFSLPTDVPLPSDFPGLFELVTLDDDEKTRLGDGEGVKHVTSFDYERGGFSDTPDSRHLEWHITPLSSGGDQSRLLLTQVQDVTERKMAEEAKLQEAREAAKKARQLVVSLRQEVQQSFSFSNMVSRSPQMRKIFSLLPQMAETTTTVLINGESGTGKELVAKALHDLSERKEKPFIAINCSALPDNLLESELFGYKAGAFTDAKKDKPGKFALADGGVIFLDEIGDISTAMQAKLLRVLQERTFEPLGATTSKKVDVRVVAATNKNLAEMVKKGEFRDDLFYRMNILKIKLPPLRERKSDIPLLCDHFIGLLNGRYDKSISGMSPEVLDRLLTYGFPGNIRELENIIEHAFVFCKDGSIQLFHLPEELAGSPEEIHMRSLQSYGSLEDLEAHYIRAVLDEVDGNRIQAAKRLDIHKSTLFRKLKKLGIGAP